MRCAWITLVVGSLMLMGRPVCVCAEVPPPPPRDPAAIVIDDFNYANAEAARKVWRERVETNDAGERIADRSGVPATPVTIGGRHALKLVCNFKGTQLDRAYWDGAIKIDLGTASAITFDVFVDNVAPIGSASLYLHSGDGWYSGHWFPDKEGAWCRVCISKGDFGVEGSPAGWRKIDCIRISPWMGQHENATIYVANLCAVGSNSPVLLVRREFGKNEQSTEARGALRYAGIFARFLQDAGVVIGIASSLDLSADMLKDKKVVILPYQASMREETGKLLARFIRTGGKVIACFSLEENLANALGIKYVTGRGEKYPGEFTRMHFLQGELPGAPTYVDQYSWRTTVVEPVAQNAHVIAWWETEDGKRSDAPAVVLSDTGAFIGHVITNNDPVGKRTFLRALVAHFCPDVLRIACENRLRTLGQSVGAFDWAGAEKIISSQPAFGAAARSELDKAASMRALAEKKQKQGDFNGALAAAEKAESLLVEAYCLAQQPLPGEIRAAWCHHPEGVRGWSWEQSAQVLADAGINTLFVNMLWGASSGYPSKVLPLHAEVPKGSNYLKECVKACTKRGIKVHIWMVNNNLGPVGARVPTAVYEKLKAEGRLQIDRNGNTRNWLCPSNEKNIEMQVKAMVEAAQMPGVTGIHFDYIRYPGTETCYCPTCRKHFEERIGHAVENWPDDVLPGGKLHAEWVQFRCDNITEIVRRVHDEVKRVSPKTLISAAVFHSYPNCRETVGQDWKLWCEKGYLDFVCPMDYTSSDAQFEGWVRNQLAAIDRVIPLYPGIGCFRIDNPVGVFRQIKIARRYKTGGWVLFDLSSTTARSVFPFLAKGLNPPTKKPGDKRTKKAAMNR